MILYTCIFIMCISIYVYRSVYLCLWWLMNVFGFDMRTFLVVLEELPPSDQPWRCPQPVGRDNAGCRDWTKIHRETGLQRDERHWKGSGKASIHWKRHHDDTRWLIHAWSLQLCFSDIHAGDLRQLDGFLVFVQLKQPIEIQRIWVLTWLDRWSTLNSADTHLDCLDCGFT